MVGAVVGRGWGCRDRGAGEGPVESRVWGAARGTLWSAWQRCGLGGLARHQAGPAATNTRRQSTAMQRPCRAQRDAPRHDARNVLGGLPLAQLDGVGPQVDCVPPQLEEALEGMEGRASTWPGEQPSGSTYACSWQAAPGQPSTLSTHRLKRHACAHGGLGEDHGQRLAWGQGSGRWAAAARVGAGCPQCPHSRSSLGNPAAHPPTLDPPANGLKLLSPPLIRCFTSIAVSSMATAGGAGAAAGAGGPQAQGGACRAAPACTLCWPIGSLTQTYWCSRDLPFVCPCTSSIRMPATQPLPPGRKQAASRRRHRPAAAGLDCCPPWPCGHRSGPPASNAVCGDCWAGLGAGCGCPSPTH